MRIGGSVVKTRGKSTYRPFFFFNDTATTEIYTLSLHDALPILLVAIVIILGRPAWAMISASRACCLALRDRKSTRLNSSHANISYAVFCLKKKKKLLFFLLPIFCVLLMFSFTLSRRSFYCTHLA